MDKLITVSEYCSINNVTVQSVYARIKRGTLKYEVQNGVKMVLNDYTMQDSIHIEPKVNDRLNDYTMLLQSTIKSQKKEIKRLHKTIKKLEKQNTKSIDTLLKLFSNNTNQIGFDSSNTKEDVFIEADIKSKKKKSGKKKSKK